MEYLHRKLADIKAADGTRNDFLQELISQIESLTSERDKAQSDLERLEDICTYYQRDYKTSKLELQTLQKSMERSAFVLVLIDGDDTKFADDYIRRGLSGGDDAARDLRTQIAKYLEGLEGFQPHWEIIIKVYSKMNGLSKTYYDARIIDDPIRLRQFAQGFNTENPLCDYVDAGDDKEGADKKIQDTMKLFFHNVHCKHIMLGASADQSYNGFLRQFMLTDGVCDRVTLIESIPFPSAVAEIAKKFLHIRFDDVFRNNKIVVKRLSGDDRVIMPARTPVTSYASLVSKNGEPINVTAASVMPRPPPTPPLSSPSHPSGDRSLIKIHHNRQGYRIDLPVNYDKALVPFLKERKLCNRFALSWCTYTDCVHEHDSSLSPTELETLRFIARMSPCPASIRCDDPGCVMGHRCIYDGKCSRGKACRFAEDMHNVDMKVVDVVKV